MTKQIAPDSNGGLPLPGLDGTNPLSFLAALGVLCCIATESREPIPRMSWTASGSTWIPILCGCALSVPEVAQVIASKLELPKLPDVAAEQKKIDSEKRFKKARKKVEKAEITLKQKELRGKDKEKAEQLEVEPLRERLERRRKIWLQRLQRTVPSPEIALGKHLNATIDEFRDLVSCTLRNSTQNSRDVADLLASFGSDACQRKNSQQIEPTPFCFTTGSGHQYFLDTVGALFRKVDATRLENALSKQEEPSDEKLSMRWDPVEDRRYAMMWDDPTASNNKTKTNWAINLLAYQGLQLLPAMPGPHRLETTGWVGGSSKSWTWPIWHGDVSLQLIRSLLAHPQLTGNKIDKSSLAHIGVAAVYSVSRIQVGTPPLHKLNFTPAQRIA